ncbi:ABC transporter ATP-binding protein/permease [Christensenellaceae bacterium OttesenSCG-928-M15]|nr:ABC transporter ATP-binding protein/permease [Christensenellaceae bacterium OttesenSCG-928-M15]
MTQRKEKRAQFSGSTIKRLLKYITGTYRLRFIMVLVFIIVSAAASVAGSLFLQTLIDDYIAPLMGIENPVFTGLLWAIATMGVIYLAGVISTYVYNRQMVVIGQGVQKRIRDEMFAHMQKLPIKYFDTHSYGDIMSRYTNDIDTLRQMISQSVPMLFSSLVTMLFVLCAMLYTSLPLTILVLVMVFFMVKVSGKITGKSSSYFIKQQKALGEINGYIEEMMDGQKVVKVFCYETDAEKKFDEKNEQLFESGNNANKYANVLMPVMTNLSSLAYVLVAIAGGAMSLGGAGALTLGAIATFLQLTKSFSQPISQMSQQVNSIIMALAGAERIFTLMDEPIEEDDGYVTLVNAVRDENGKLCEAERRTGLFAWKHPHHDGTLTYVEVKGDIVFDNVDFSYDGEKAVLYNVSLFAKPGQKIAFVGATGAGKTTITNLLNRFYDIADGKIRYDGININKIRKSDLRRSLGIVLQDTHLFTGTVMNNIRYGKLDATDEEVIAAARLAGADSFISRLPDGYDTVLTGDGASLSQGQRQLLAIARAAVADPPVMILDEATSSIDTRTEKLVQSGMDALMEGRTVLVIAHRLSTVQNSRVILVLDHGRIIERGSHEELIDQKGRYYELYTGAFESADEYAQETA